MWWVSVLSQCFVLVFIINVLSQCFGFCVVLTVSRVCAVSLSDFSSGCCYVVLQRFEFWVCNALNGVIYRRDPATIFINSFRRAVHCMLTFVTFWGHQSWISPVDECRANEVIHSMICCWKLVAFKEIRWGWLQYWLIRCALFAKNVFSYGSSNVS